MNDAKKEQIIAAADAWRAAEKAYHDEALKYVSFGFMNAGPIPDPDKVLTHDALQELKRLREAAAKAQQAYEEVL